MPQHGYATAAKLDSVMNARQHFVAMNSCISVEVGAKFQTETCPIGQLYNYTELVSLLNIEVTVSSIIKCKLQKSIEMLQKIVEKWPLEKKIYILVENLTSLEQGIHTIL